MPIALNPWSLFQSQTDWRKIINYIEKELCSGERLDPRASDVRRTVPSAMTQIQGALLKNLARVSCIALAPEFPAVCAQRKMEVIGGQKRIRPRKLPRVSGRVFPEPLISMENPIDSRGSRTILCGNATPESQSAAPPSLIG